MSKRNDEPDGRSGAGTARRQRLAAALRDNLAKRKAQSRARESTAAVGNSADAVGETPAADGDPDSDPGDDSPARGC